jgi:sarcosine oxidase subunit beta
VSDVSIIGGGVIGWSIAYHLLNRESKLNVAVFERQRSFGMGSTSLAAGGVRAQFGTTVNIDLALQSIAEFERFPKEIGADIGFHQYGYLFVTATSGGLEYQARAAELQRERGVPVRELGPADVRTVAPFLECSDILGGSFSPTDGYLDPYAVCQGYEKAARSLGAQARYGEVFAESEGGITVLAAGHWSNSAGKRFGVELPIRPVRHSLAMTESVGELFPEKLPMVVDRDTSFHFRREGECLLIGYDDKDETPADEDVRPGFDFGFLERLAPVAIHRLPISQQLRFDYKKCWSGYYAETPDKHGIIGEVGGIIAATGFGGHGIMHSPAVGTAVAEIILDGASHTVDVRSLRPERFEEDDLVVEEMTI